MHLEGSHRLAATAETVWKLLNDPDVLARVSPGISELRPLGDDRFEAVFQIKMGPVNSSFEGTFELRDKREPLGYRLITNAEGRIGTIAAEGTFKLRREGDETIVSFEGDARLTGILARMGQRVLSGVGRMFTNQFFRALEGELP